VHEDQPVARPRERRRHHTAEPAGRSGHEGDGPALRATGCRVGGMMRHPPILTLQTRRRRRAPGAGVQAAAAACKLPSWRWPVTGPHRINPPTLFPGVPYDYAAVAQPGSLVFTAGACPLDAQGDVVGPGDLEAQALCALDNLSATLAEAGSSLD